MSLGMLLPNLSSCLIMRVKHMAQPYGILLLQIMLKLCPFCSSKDATEQSALNPEDEGTMTL